MTTVAGYNTSNEKQYIDQLISGAAFSGPGIPYKPQHPPEERLMLYIKHAKRRKAQGTFGQVDADEVIAYAESILERIGGEQDGLDT